MRAKVYDCFIFFDELDLVDIRFAELDQVVDFFVVVEADMTFKGEPKPLTFQENIERWAPYHDKIIHVVVDDFDKDATPFQREDLQREAMLRGLRGAAPDDYVILSDCDEIADGEMVKDCIKSDTNGPNLFLFGVKEYQFKLNWLCHSTFERVLLGPRMLRRRHLGKVRAVRKVMQKRSTSTSRWLEKLIWAFYSLRSYGTLLDRRFVLRAAWHFSSVKDPEMIHKKINAYAHDWKEEYGWDDSKKAVVERLAKLIAEKRDSDGNPVCVTGLDDMPRLVANEPQRFAHMLDLEGMPLERRA